MISSHDWEKNPNISFSSPNDSTSTLLSPKKKFKFQVFTVQLIFWRPRLFFGRSKNPPLWFKVFSGIGGTQTDRMSRLKSENFSLSKSDKPLLRYTLKRR